MRRVKANMGKSRRERSERERQRSERERGSAGVKEENGS